MKPKKETILIIDDEKDMRFYLENLMTSFGYNTASVGSGHEALEKVKIINPSLIVLDLMMPEMDGIEVLKRLKEINGDIPVIMLSAHGHTDNVVKAMKIGASDFINKPFEPEVIEITISQVLERKNLLIEVRRLKEEINKQSRYDLVFSSSKKMTDIRSIIEQVAETNITVLVRGESGTGKELVARAIHTTSLRRDKPFVKVLCTALPDNLLESELFGYEKGAFTGAIRRKPGKFELANSGTIFLDEIGDMHPSLQSKLLQVLQDGEFARIGGESDVKVDVRVIAATNKDLDKAVKDGSFREDLFYRLNVVSIVIPPLRERKEDIPFLIEHFLNKYNTQYNKDLKKLSDETMARFTEYNWPGNVRELENMIKRVVILGNEKTVLTRFKGLDIQTDIHYNENQMPKIAGAEQKAIPGNGFSLKSINKRALAEVEKEAIKDILYKTHWNRREAAQMLKISYKSLLNKIKEYELDKV
ncbi:MAG: sigma-54 dependent transcriptional regulator [Nitrospirota bacterium]